jgi:allantoinase
VALGAVAKCAPPLRSAADRADLRAEVDAGSVALVASDHSPAPPEMKRARDFSAVWGGISGCQTLLQVLLTLGLDAQALAAAAPANRLRLPGKGRLAVGADADLVLVDAAAAAPLRAEDLQYRHPQSPFVGRTLRGRIVRTILRGRTVWADGAPVGRPAGRLVRPRAPG